MKNFLDYPKENNTLLMIIATIDKISLKRLVLNKWLQELFIRPKDNKSYVARCFQPFGNSLVQFSDIGNQS